MKRLHVVLSFGMICLGLFLAAFVVRAEDAPVSKCVTTATQATRDKALAQMEKDIAPYAKEEKASAVIAEYKQNLQIAWEAMEHPYCGYGAYGNASAIKSFSKSITRAREAFLSKIKDPGKAVVMKQEVVQVSLAEDSLKSTSTTQTKKVKTLAKSDGSESVRSGLRKGMRSEAVKILQKKLAKHFGVAESDLVTGYFGPMTQKYVIKYQLEKKLISGTSSTAAGLVGPKTCASLNAL